MLKTILLTLVLIARNLGHAKFSCAEPVEVKL